MNIKPQNNQVIISWKNQSKEDLIKRAAKSGLVISDTTEGESMIIELGEVIAVSSKIIDKNGEVMDIKVGDKVLFATFHPYELELDGEKAFSLPASEIVAILVDAKE